MIARVKIAGDERWYYSVSGATGDGRYIVLRHLNRLSTTYHYHAHVSLYRDGPEVTRGLREEKEQAIDAFLEQYQ